MSIESNLRFLVDYRWGGDLVTMDKDEARALLALIDAARDVYVERGPYEVFGLEELRLAVAKLEAEE